MTNSIPPFAYNELLRSYESMRYVEDVLKGGVEAIYNISTLSFNIGVGVSTTKQQWPNLETIKWTIEKGLEQIYSKRLTKVFSNEKELRGNKHINLQHISNHTFNTLSSPSIDTVEVLNRVVLDLKDSIHVVIPETLIDMFSEGFEIPSLKRLEKLESAFQNSVDFQWKRYCHLLLVMCYCDLGIKSELVESCNGLIASEYFKTEEDLIFISTQLYMLAEKSKDFELLRDSFIIISHSNLIYPIKTDKMMVVIGECLLNQFTISNENMLFLEFVSRRISTCNNGTHKLARTFCSIHGENVKIQLRNSVLKPSVLFTEDLKRILEKPHKANYFEENIERFDSNNEARFLYMALNSVYFTDYNDIFYLLSNKASKLARVNVEAQSKNFRIDDFEYSILLYNCIHNYHVIYEKYFEKIEHDLNFHIKSNSNYLNCKGYYEAVKQFLLGYFSPRTNFKTKLITDFKLTFHAHFIRVIKENLKKISQKTNPKSDLNKEFCEQHRTELSRIHSDCFKFVNESLNEIDKSFENRAERYILLRKEQGENIDEGSLSSRLHLETLYGNLTFEPCEDDFE